MRWAFRRRSMTRWCRPGGNAIAVLRERVERLACDFPIQDNYFAWQAFGRGYDLANREAVPAYLRREVYDG